MPSDETNGLITNCFLKRNFPNEVLISRNNLTLDKLESNPRYFAEAPVEIITVLV